MGMTEKHTRFPMEFDMTSAQTQQVSRDYRNWTSGFISALFWVLIICFHFQYFLVFIFSSECKIYQCWKELIKCYKFSLKSYDYVNVQNFSISNCHQPQTVLLNESRKPTAVTLSIEKTDLHFWHNFKRLGGEKNVKHKVYTDTTPPMDREKLSIYSVW